MSLTNETHDPAARSWVASAQDAASDFPIQNLPFAIFRRQGSEEAFRAGVAIGDQIVDLAAGAGDVFTGAAATAAAAGARDSLNDLMALAPEFHTALRLQLFHALREGSEKHSHLEPHLIPQAQAEYDVPAHIGDYTDFYTSVHHATTVGKQFRPDNPLLPNYKWVPIGYHGRASSIGVSGQRFKRPLGQTKAPDSETPSFGPSKRLDYELELGWFIGRGNPLGAPIGIEKGEDHLFGVTLFNDWSARDIQGWEYQPLGPFLSKNFASTVSPWLVTLEALAPFRVAFTRPEGDPQPLTYLDSESNRRVGAFSIDLEVLIQTASMRDAAIAPVRLSRTNAARAAYWTPAQLVAHHTVNGCNLRPGDLLGSGTLSGPEAAEAGSLMELTGGGKAPIELPNGERRVFLEDGDALIIRGWCEAHGARRIGLGEVSGIVEAR
ncbi:fumarylacetoacetase [Variovorax guangxiensis]|uniref:fumarylacetoacetase n=1 Tax=Variovorax guangxiensis TaxID=1775474 RepID=UPI00285BEC8E|nr:fumarylacetoacetase [Variovorax guangxiensis]MDR6858629.1 fumarylacetoacetase [Variovorax guangxiensis]